MRKLLTRMAIAGVVLAMAAFAADHSLGTWKLNMEKSKFTPSAPVKSLTTVRDASDGGVKVTTTGERSDGTPINASYTAKYDGAEYPVTGAPYDSISMKQVNPNTFSFLQRSKTSKYRVAGRNVVSKDGKTMTTTFKGTNSDGKPYSATMIWDKQ